MAAGKKHKFSPDPASPIGLLAQDHNELADKVRLLQDKLQVPTIHTFDKDADYIDPTQGEIFWNFPNQRSYVWHHDRWRPTQPPTHHIKVVADTRIVTTGDDKFMFMASRDMDGFRLIDAEAYVTTAGACTVNIRNKTTATDLLSSPLVITSLVDTGTRVLTTNTVSHQDIISIDVDAAGGKGLGVILVWNPPIP